MLIKCLECGREISDKAESCPHCGAPVSIPNETYIPQSPDCSYEMCIRLFMRKFEQCLNSINNSFSAMPQLMASNGEGLAQILEQVSNNSDYAHKIIDAFSPAIKSFDEFSSSWNDISTRILKMESVDEKESCVQIFTSKIVEIAEKFHNVPECSVSDFSAECLNIWSGYVKALGFVRLAIELKKKAIDYHSFAHAADYYAKGKSVELYSIFGNAYRNLYKDARKDMDKAAEDIRPYDKKFYSSYIHNRNLFESRTKWGYLILATSLVGVIIAVNIGSETFNQHPIYMLILILPLFFLGCKSLYSVYGYEKISPGDVSNGNIDRLIKKDRKN